MWMNVKTTHVVQGLFAQILQEVMNVHVRLDIEAIRRLQMDVLISTNARQDQHLFVVMEPIV